MSDLSEYLGIAGLYQLPESKFVNLPPGTRAALLREIQERAR